MDIRQNTLGWQVWKVAALALFACEGGPSAGGEVGDPGEGLCEIVSSTVLDRGEAEQSVDFLGAYQGTLTDPAGDETAVNLQLSFLEDAEEVMRQATEPGAVCPPEVHAKLRFSLQSEDGIFDDMAENSVTKVPAQGAATIHAGFSVEALQGSFDVASVVDADILADALPPRLNVALAVDRSGPILEGSLSVHLQLTNGMFEDGMTVRNVKLGSLRFEPALLARGLHMKCEAGECAPGQECTSGFETSTCELPCDENSPCPFGFTCNLPPVLPDTIPNVCVAE